MGKVVSGTRLRQWAIACILSVLAAVPRLWGLGATVTWDEPMWAFRSARFLHALTEHKPADTFQVGAPGVITMWSGATGIAFERFGLRRHEDAWNQVIRQPSLDLEDQATLKALGQFLPATRVPLALLSAMTVGLAFLWLRRLGIRQSIALLAGCFMALDPFLIGHSRVLHTDGPETAFLTLSLLALLMGLQSPRPKGDRRGGWLVGSGALAGLAVLSKAPAGIFVAVAALLIGWRAIRAGGCSRRALGEGLRDLSLWGLGAAGAFVVFWPAMWATPVETVKRMLGLAERFARTPHIDNFFLGEHVRDPGPLFYPLSLAMRTTPVIWLGWIAALPLILRPQRRHLPVRVLWLSVLLYGAAITVSAKKFERYLLPAYPLLDLVAASGWVGLAEAVRPRWQSPSGQAAKAWLPVAVILAALLQGASALPYRPHYLFYANPILGGPRQAARWLPAGWGEGLEEAAAYLEADPSAQVAALWAVPSFAPLYSGQVVRLTEANLALADHAIVYIGDVQFGSPLTERYYGRESPVYTVTLHGAEVAWVYRLEVPEAQRLFLAQEVGDEDAILTDAPLLVVRTYQGQASILQVSPAADEAAIAQALNTLATERDRDLWFLSSEATDEALRELVARQLGTHALQVASPQEFAPGVQLSRYLIPAHTQFQPTVADRPAEVAFGGTLRLTGFGCSATRVEAPQALELALRWQAVAPPGRDVTAFAHLLDAADHRWAQDDVLVRNEKGQETGRWAAGTGGLTRHLLHLPPGIPPGRYTLVVGLYDPEGNRLPIAGDADMAWELTEVEVVSPRLALDPSTLQPTITLQLPAWPGLVLWGASVPEGTFHPGEELTVSLDWTAERDLQQDLNVQFALRGQTQWDEPLAAYPTSRWSAGELIHALYDLRLPADLPSGGHLLTVCVYPRGTAGGCGASIELGHLEVVAREHRFSPPAEMHPVADAAFGPGIHLLGYSLEPAEPRPGSTLVVTLYWQARETPQDAYNVFVHLADAQGWVWAQWDQVPGAGEAPTPGWLPGEVIADEVALPIGADTPAGGYHLLVGLYDAAGSRLSLPNGDTAYTLTNVSLHP
ncbi:MAG: ArnT family glycosyltransferase [Anaerolineae bacterium]